MRLIFTQSSIVLPLSLQKKVLVRLILKTLPVDSKAVSTYIHMDTDDFAKLIDKI